VGTTVITIEADVTMSSRWMGLPVAASRDGHSRCSVCNLKYAAAKMPSVLRVAYDQLYVATPARPVYSLLLIIMAVGIVSGIGLLIYATTTNGAVINNPRVGDVYKIKVTRQYSAVRVIRVTDDSLYIEKGNKLHDFKPDSTLGSVWISREQIGRMYRAGEVSQAYRPEN